MDAHLPPTGANQGPPMVEGMGAREALFPWRLPIIDTRGGRSRPPNSGGNGRPAVPLAFWAPRAHSRNPREPIKAPKWLREWAPARRHSLGVLGASWVPIIAHFCHLWGSIKAPRWWQEWAPLRCHFIFATLGGRSLNCGTHWAPTSATRGGRSRPPNGGESERPRGAISRSFVAPAGRPLLPPVGGD